MARPAALDPAAAAVTRAVARRKPPRPGARPRTDAELAALLETSRDARQMVRFDTQRDGLDGRARLYRRRIYRPARRIAAGGYDESDVEDLLDGARAKWNIPDGPRSSGWRG